MNKNTTKIIFSKKSDEWATPAWLFNKLDKQYNFTLDPAATEENALCNKYYTIEDDGLNKSWEGERVFLNPPYSQISKWMEKAASGEANRVVALIPGRTDTKYFHQYIFNNKRCSHIIFIKGRLKFGSSKNSAPFPSIICIFKRMESFMWFPIISTMENKQND